MKLEDRTTLREELSGLRFSEDAKERMFRRLSEEPAEAAEQKRRGKTFFRVALIAAALALVLGVGAVAKQWQKGLAERVIASASNTSDTTENDPLSKEALFERALNTIDYFDTASLRFERITNKIGLQKAEVDVDLNTSKAYEHLIGEGETDWECFCDGTLIYRYDCKFPELPAYEAGYALSRLDENKERLETTPRVYLDENETEIWLMREHYTNTTLEKYCLSPSSYVITFLNDPEHWEITGEGEYLGRQCVLVSGDVPNSRLSKYDEGVKSFTMCFDRKTGILLWLSLLGENGENVESIEVTELTVDDAEYTDARIEAALSRLWEYGVVTAETASSSEPAPEIEFQVIKADEDEIPTQETVYDRMLNTVDYYECVTVKYKTKTRPDDVEHTESIDTDIPKHISYTTFCDEINVMESYCDGTGIYAYYPKKDATDYYGNARVRTQYETEKLAIEPRYTVDENGESSAWYRSDLTNSIRSDDTVLPQGPAFLFLSDFEKWEIAGETEYLGRRCVELEGSLSDYASGKFKANSFYMCIDKLTGILLKLECYGDSGELSRYTTVSEIIVDQPEITDARIEAGIEKCKSFDSDAVYVYPTVDPSRSVSKGALYDRMLNSIDYFNTVSVSFSYCFPNLSPNEVQITIDSDLTCGKVYQSYLVAEKDYLLEDISDGVFVVRYNLSENQAWIEMPAVVREEKAEVILNDQERYYYDQQDDSNYVYRRNTTNADAASWCLFPQEFAFGFLSDITGWEITEDTEYLGRKSVTLEGTAPKQYQNKFGIETFSMRVDKATGIILSYEGYDDNGDLINYVHVSELAIDDYEGTRAKIEQAANRLENSGFTMIETPFEFRS